MTKDVTRLIVGSTIRVILSLAVIALFAYAYANNPGDDLLVGALISSFTTVVNWWLGSSQNSSDKNDTIAAHLADQATGKSDDPVHVEGKTDA